MPQMPDNSRWTILKRTSPSGKTLFQCKACGRVSISPDKHCFRRLDVYEVHCELWNAKQLLKEVLRDALLPANLIAQVGEFVEFRHDLDLPGHKREEEAIRDPER